MKIAFVYDRVNKWGGAERVLLALHGIWPEAPLYTAVYHCGKASWARVFPGVIPSFLNHFPLAKDHHEFYPWATPLAFETFMFDGFDTVISVTSAEAKNIITKPETLHICYCLTPTRYLWGEQSVYAAGSPMLQAFTPTLRRWDRFASQRPDYYIAISHRVAERIRRYYGRKVTRVIYPPVVIPASTQGRKDALTHDYFLVVSRLVPYKRVDLIIRAFNKLGWRLVVIGDGVERRRLQQMAGPTIKFVTSHLTDKELVGYYQGCRAFIAAADEDFGIAAVEAQASGRAVIAYRRSGIAEIVKVGETGALFDEQSEISLRSALVKFTEDAYDFRRCQTNAARFGVGRFQKEMKETIDMLYTEYTRTRTL